MKEKILKFFKEDRTYLGAIRLYNEVGNSLSVKKQINLQPDNIMKGILFDQLRILAGISSDEFKMLMSRQVSTAAPVEEKKDDLTIILDKKEDPVGQVPKKPSKKKQEPKNKAKNAKK